MPWAESGLAAAKSLLENIGELEEGEIRELVDGLETMLSDGPKSIAAAGRAKVMLGKVGTSGGLMFKEIAVSLITEASRRFIWG
jgi:hypothetical protein